MKDQSTTPPITERYGWGIRIPLAITETVTSTDAGEHTVWEFSPLDVPGMTAADIEQQIAAQYPQDDGTLLREALGVLVEQVTPSAEKIEELVSAAAAVKLTAVSETETITAKR